MVDSLDTQSNITVFAPSNDAFQEIGSALSNFSTDQLSSILSYHVVNGTVAYSTDLANGTNLTATNGENITITIYNGTIYADSAKVIIPNVLVANGVVHVIEE
jgi:uncharacterized surface protein with fasciclin (FAS1) repeats